MQLHGQSLQIQMHIAVCLLVSTTTGLIHEIFATTLWHTWRYGWCSVQIFGRNGNTAQTLAAQLGFWMLKESTPFCSLPTQLNVPNNKGETALTCNACRFYQTITGNVLPVELFDAGADVDVPTGSLRSRACTGCTPR
jgi:hypothetical protein